MDKDLEALILQLQKNNVTAEYTNSSIEALIKQNKDLNIQPEIDALIQQGLNLRKLLEKNNEDIKKVIESIKFPEQKEIDLSEIKKTNELLQELISESKKEQSLNVELVIE